MIKVTTIIPAFNCSSTIENAVKSVLRQHGLADHASSIVVVDDGSTDNLSAMLEPYEDMIRIVRHPDNQGAAAARNTGIAEIDSGYIAFLDADDEWLPTKLARQIAIMQTNNWSACCCAYYLRSDDGSEVVSPTYETRELSLDDIVWGCFTGPGSTLMCDRSVFEKVGLFDVRLRRLEDWDWQIRLVQQQQLGFLAEPSAVVSKSRHQKRDLVYSALATMRLAHRRRLTAGLQWQFDAASDIQRAAANYRASKKFTAGMYLLRSIIRDPFRNAALSEVLHNYLARR